MIFNEQTAQRVVNALATSLKKVFDAAFEAAESQWDQVAMQVPSTGASNTYAWIDKFPKLRKWIGDKVVKQLSGHAYTIINDDFEQALQQLHAIVLAGRAKLRPQAICHAELLNQLLAG